MTDIQEPQVVKLAIDKAKVVKFFKDFFKRDVAVEEFLRFVNCIVDTKTSDERLQHGLFFLDIVIALITNCEFQGADGHRGRHGRSPAQGGPK